jgi:hypothetical protein
VEFFSFEFLPEALQFLDKIQTKVKRKKSAKPDKSEILKAKNIRT